MIVFLRKYLHASYKYTYAQVHIYQHRIYSPFYTRNIQHTNKQWAEHLAMQRTVHNIIMYNVLVERFLWTYNNNIINNNNKTRTHDNNSRCRIYTLYALRRGPMVYHVHTYVCVCAYGVRNFKHPRAYNIYSRPPTPRISAVVPLPCIPVYCTREGLECLLLARPVEGRRCGVRVGRGGWRRKDRENMACRVTAAAAALSGRKENNNCYTRVYVYYNTSPTYQPIYVCL